MRTLIPVAVVALVLASLLGCPSSPGPVTPSFDADAQYVVVPPASPSDAAAPLPLPIDPRATAACHNLAKLPSGEACADGTDPECEAVLTQNLVKTVFPLDMQCMTSSPSLAALCARCSASVSCCPDSGAVSRPKSK
jgi:hypothetical protein